jgi:hypothetical protein
MLREADDIMLQELVSNGIYNAISQAFVVLLPVKSVGVMGDNRTYEQACAIRCVTTDDFMTADWYHMDYALLGTCHACFIDCIRLIEWFVWLENPFTWVRGAGKGDSCTTGCILGVAGVNSIHVLTSLLPCRENCESNNK